MQNSQYFHLFSFKPQKLIEERKKVEKKFKDIDKEVTLSRSQVLLPELLKKIRQTSSKDINKLSQSLSKVDIRLLTYKYPFRDESNETRHKINRILSIRYTTVVGRTAWDLFQQDVSDLFLQDLIQQSYLQERTTFLGIGAAFLVPFQRMVANSLRLIDSLVSYMLNASEKTAVVLKEWKVKEDSVLERTLLKEMLLKGLRNNTVISRDGEEYIVQCLEKFALDDYKQLLKEYIEPREYEEFHPTIMHDATKYRLGDPRDREVEWSFLSEEALMQVKRWSIQKNLNEIFESDPDNMRLKYWKRFIRDMDDVHLIEKPKVAFIYFHKFVVVEFGNIGAAYFYHRKGFKKFIEPIEHRDFRKTNSMASRENMLKNRNEVEDGTKLFITRLTHVGNWPAKFDKEMQEYLHNVNR